MATDRVRRTPEEAVTALSRQVAEGAITRQELLRKLIKLGLDEQKRWKAIRLVESGKMKVSEAARIANLPEDEFRDLLE